jgi:hypothetical protein
LDASVNALLSSVRSSASPGDTNGASIDPSESSLNASEYDVQVDDRYIRATIDASMTTVDARGCG